MPLRFNVYDLAYYVGVGVASPVWLIKPSARKKVMRAFRERMGHVPARENAASTPAVLIHAVRMGEINATRALVEMLLSRRDDVHLVISTTTDTGFQRGQDLFGANPRITMIRYPLDFSSAIHRALDALRPSAVILMELELWPNFVRACAARGIKVILANGRLTEESFGRYLLIKPIVRRMLRRVERICVQDDLYAQRFMSLGAEPSNVTVIGTMKFDTATIADRVEGDEQLAREVGLNRSEPIWVCGSTGPGEEEIVLRIFRRIREKIARLRLVIVPRKPERFDEVANLIQSQGFTLTRRSTPGAPPRDDSVVLIDTMGELRKIYSLGSVVFVGRSLVDLGTRQHGSDMIEPCALGKATIVGPFTGNFADAMRSFKASQAIVEVPDESALAATLSALLLHPSEAKALGTRARSVVRAQQGATARHAQIVLDALDHVVKK
jgi:3-deoxy-D-manno-octulosonic-acid transferase